MSRPLVVVELFAGTATLSAVARSRGHEAFAIDLESPDADLLADIRQLSISDLPEAFRAPDVVWLSPPCDTFSVLTVRHYWQAGRPHGRALDGIEVLSHGLRLLMQLSPAVWFMENPRAMMRTLPLLADVRRHTVTYCQYGEAHMKPTDVWTNSQTWAPRAACKKGAPCHIASPRGSSAGLISVESKRERARLPVELCREVIEAAEQQLGGAVAPRSRLPVDSPLFPAAAS